MGKHKDEVASSTEELVEEVLTEAGDNDGVAEETSNDAPEKKGVKKGKTLADLGEWNGNHPQLGNQFYKEELVQVLGEEYPFEEKLRGEVFLDFKEKLGITPFEPARVGGAVASTQKAKINALMEALTEKGMTEEEINTILSSAVKKD